MSTKKRPGPTSYNEALSQLAEPFRGISFKKFKVKEWIMFVFSIGIIAFATFLLVDSFIFNLSSASFGVSISKFWVFLIACFMFFPIFLFYLVTVFVFIFMPLSMAKHNEDTKKSKTKSSKSAASYSILKDSDKKNRIIGIIIFIIIGLGSVACFGWYAYRQTVKAGYTPVMATVVDVINRGDGYTSNKYAYKVNDHVYYHVSETKSKSDGPMVDPIGKTFTLYYNANNPTEVYTGDSENFILGFGLFLLFFLIVGLFGTFSNLEKTPYFFVAFTCLGITSIAGFFMWNDTKAPNFIEFVRYMPMFQCVLLFGYLGLFFMVYGFLNLFKFKETAPLPAKAVTELKNKVYHDHAVSNPKSKKKTVDQLVLGAGIDNGNKKGTKRK